MPSAEQAAAVDAREAESFAFLARKGYLTDAEVAALEERAEGARDRIGTNRQRGQLLGGGIWLGADRTIVAIAEAIALELALRERAANE